MRVCGQVSEFVWVKDVVIKGIIFPSRGVFQFKIVVPV